jgi:hypothetical protein
VFDGRIFLTVGVTTTTRGYMDQITSFVSKIKYSTWYSNYTHFKNMGFSSNLVKKLIFIFT